ncbi:unnamed protein product [Sphagnum compactum]
MGRLPFITSLLDILYDLVDMIHATSQSEFIGAIFQCAKVAESRSIGGDVRASVHFSLPPLQSPEEPPEMLTDRTWRQEALTPEDTLIRVPNDIHAAYAATISVNPPPRTAANSMVGVGVIRWRACWEYVRSTSSAATGLAYALSLYV